MNCRATITACALLGAAAAAQDTERGVAVWQHLLAAHDGNRDGVITAAEYRRGGDAFARLDRDGDGRLTAADFAGVRRGGQGATPPAGMPPPDRMMALEIAKCADLDRSGRIDGAEWRALLAAITADDRGTIDTDALGVGREAAMGQQVVRAADRDRDSTLSVGDLQATFALLDGDADGVLARAELGPWPWPGDDAPDFALRRADDATALVTLSSYRGRQPVALIFGSYT